MRIAGSRTVVGCIRRRWRRDVYATGAPGLDRLNATVCSAPESSLAGMRIRAESPQCEFVEGCWRHNWEFASVFSKHSLPETFEEVLHSTRTNLSVNGLANGPFWFRCWVNDSVSPSSL